MIEVRGLSKRYGSTVAVNELSFDVRPGVVTGFLGPNGSGKSTTMRMILGLARRDAGQARINGLRYGQLRWPLREVGAVLEAKAFHPGRRAHTHLAALAASNAHPAKPGGSGARHRRAGWGRMAARRRLLAGHVAAAGHRGSAARRPGGA